MAEPNDDGAPGGRREVFSTRLPPRDAAKKAVDAIGTRFGLPVSYEGGPGGLHDKFVNVNPERTAQGDYFSGTTYARTARGEYITIECEWVRDGETRVTLTSDLSAPQHAAVTAEVRRVFIDDVAPAAATTTSRAP